MTVEEYNTALAEYIKSRKVEYMDTYNLFNAGIATPGYGNAFIKRNSHIVHIDTYITVGVLESSVVDVKAFMATLSSDTNNKHISSSLGYGGAYDGDLEELYIEVTWSTFKDEDAIDFSSGQRILEEAVGAERGRTVYNISPDIKALFLNGTVSWGQLVDIQRR